MREEVGKSSQEHLRRSAAFIAEHGDISVELDALPIQVLMARVKRDVEDEMDLPALAEVKELEDDDRSRITLEWK